jgi:hypothetical protein
MNRHQLEESKRQNDYGRKIGDKVWFHGSEGKTSALIINANYGKVFTVVQFLEPYGEIEKGDLAFVPSSEFENGTTADILSTLTKDDIYALKGT